MIFISAGHNPQVSIRTGKIDPGAVGCGKKEADLTVIQRNMTSAELTALQVPHITDKDNESLGEYLDRIKTGSGSVVLEFHFDAAATVASGCTAIVGIDADRLDRSFAREIVDITSIILGIKNRGIITEAQSHRGSLGLMREQGIVALLEIGFITNCDDIKRWEERRANLAKSYAYILSKYEKLID